MGNVYGKMNFNALFPSNIQTIAQSSNHANFSPSKTKPSLRIGGRRSSSVSESLPVRRVTRQLARQQRESSIRRSERLRSISNSSIRRLNGNNQEGGGSTSGNDNSSRLQQVASGDATLRRSARLNPLSRRPSGNQTANNRTGSNSARSSNSRVRPSFPLRRSLRLRSVSAGPRSR